MNTLKAAAKWMIKEARGTGAQAKANKIGLAMCLLFISLVLDSNFGGGGGSAAVAAMSILFAAVDAPDAVLLMLLLL
ncbi:hypothetical protein Acr_26g0008080 [Actinidia rufa]|uniref:Uncharacterized protein n=1 Tax=Actinidia rufa TaxID=165716 RepID=A0A7J0H3F8_9ERIC|nr:hypothetical protein Acr_26g0008080 [Actinidia rufa]